LLALAVTSLVLYVPVSRQERQDILASKTVEAMMVTRLFTAALVAPLMFTDDRAAEEHAHRLTENDEVVYAAAWAVDADISDLDPILLAEVRRTSVPILGPTVHADVRSTITGDLLLVEGPVPDPKGRTVGLVQVAFSLANVNRQIATAQRWTLLGFLVHGAAIAAAIVALTRVLVVRRLARLAASAQRLAEGAGFDTDERANDEIGALARSFRGMAETMRDRELEVSAKNRALHRVLDNVAEGFLTVTLEGAIAGERSRALDAWFGPPRSASFFDYMAGVAPAAAPWIKLGFVALSDGIMPLEVVLDQMGHRFAHAERWYDVEFRPVEDRGVLVQLLVVVRDVTERVERERSEQAQRAAIAVFRRVVVDRSGFDEFVGEASALVDVLRSGEASGDQGKVLRAIHTLKGITSLFDLDVLAAFCHELEQRMLEEGTPPTPAERAQLSAHWSGVLALRDQLKGGAKVGIEVPFDDYDRLLRELDAHVDPRATAAFVRSWRHERATVRLDRLVRQLRATAKRMGKGELDIVTWVRPADLRLPQSRWAPIWAASSHLVRNTVDHGIESPPARRAAGKPPHAVISLSLAATRDGVELAISDDGGGVQWDAIRDRALALGLPADTGEDLEAALFSDAVSSRATVTETSGRGIGLAAVRDAVVGCGGSIVVESEPGAGTTFRLLLPAAMLETDAVSRTREAA